MIGRTRPAWLRRAIVVLLYVPAALCLGCATTVVGAAAAHDWSRRNWRGR